jgi:hypothetical protein
MGWWLVLFEVKMFLQNVRDVFHSWNNLPL